MKPFDRVRYYRKELGLSQEYIGEILNVSKTTIIAIESGERSIKAEELSKFSEAFGVTSDELLHGNDSENQEIKIFSKYFPKLSEKDRLEIMNLVELKKRLEGVKSGEGSLRGL